MPFARKPTETNKRTGVLTKKSRPSQNRRLFSIKTRKEENELANENGNKIKLLVLWDILCKNTDENHAMNADEIREELEKRGISVMRKVVATDIAALNNFGYEVLY